MCGGGGGGGVGGGGAYSFLIELISFQKEDKQF